MDFSNREWPTELFKTTETPFYYYDIKLLRSTLDEVKATTAEDNNYMVHYAIKANANPGLLKVIAEAGFGADCVSGGEILEARKAGIPGEKIVFAGVGKTDRDIRIGLEHEILCFNAESEPEIEVIDAIAGEMGKRARIAIRVNPDLEAHTHAHITTGKAENKFGIALKDIDRVISLVGRLDNLDLIGLHFHIGSQILEMDDFITLCKRINALTADLESKGVRISYINVGGGLGVDYENPDEHPIPDFKKYFDAYRSNLNLKDNQTLHFELGRALIAQCGSLISRVVYVKQGEIKKFVILDAGMTDLIRPALYDAHHLIENITSGASQKERYDVVGPICESTDVFGKDVVLPLTQRGDLIAIRSAGAYGESMASQYNCRKLPGVVFGF